METPVLFEEVQHFRQKWIWAILWLVNTFLLASFVSGIIKHHGTDRDAMAELLIGLVINVLAQLFIKNAKLITQIRADGIYLRFAPFHASFKYFSWENIQQVYVRQYNPIGEYGGWGIRYSPFGTAFNVSGNTGIQLILHNGARVLIGTNQPDDAATALLKLGRLTTF